MTRREFITLLGRAAAWPLIVALPAEAAQKLPRLCFVTFDPGTLETNRFGVFFSELSDLGYVDDKTIAIDYLSADGDGERFSGLAEECLRRGADVIAVSTTPAAKAAKAGTSTVSIVMLGLIDPTGSGLVATLARPGGNITGQAVPAPELGTKRLPLLTELLPGVKRVRVLFYPADPIDAPQIRELKQAAGTLGLTLQLRFGRAEDFPSAFEDQGSEPAQALLTTAESIFLVKLPHHRIGDAAPAACYLRASPLRARGRPDGLFPKSFSNKTGCRLPGGSHLERRQTGRPAGRATDKIQAGGQSQGREGDRPHRAAIAFAARQRSHRMKRRDFLAVPTSLVLRPLAAAAQPVRQRYLIGVLAQNLQPGLLDAFRAGLRDLGYSEGENIGIEVRNAEGRNDRLAVMATELLSRNVDLILAVNTPAAQAAKKATTTVPIVIMRVADPIKSGLIVSLARPGGNVTGMYFMLAEFGAKGLELLHEIAPKIARIGILYQADNPASPPMAAETASRAAPLGFQFLRLPVGAAADFPDAFARADRERIEALFVIDDGTITKERQEIIALAGSRSWPVVSIYKDFADAGGLIAYGPNLPVFYRHAAYYVDKILKGAKPADLPVEQPSKFDLRINLKAARALGLTVPQSLLARADEIIE